MVTFHNFSLLAVIKIYASSIFYQYWMKNLHVSACGKINILLSLCIMSSFTVMSDYTYARRIQTSWCCTASHHFRPFLYFSLHCIFLMMQTQSIFQLSKLIFFFALLIMWYIKFPFYCDAPLVCASVTVTSTGQLPWVCYSVPVNKFLCTAC
jgi:hypothetical protein